MVRSFLLLFVLCIAGLNSPDPVLGQAKPAGAATSPLCTQDNALEMIRQQVALTKSFDTTQRITALIRAADLLWPYQQDKARAAFTEAFDLAINEKEPADLKSRPRSLLLRMRVPDQRHVVIRAVAKHDPAWAKALIEQAVKLDTEAAEESHTSDSFNRALTGNRLLQSATQLLTTDINAALELARASLNFPASFMLTSFLFRFAEVNQKGADQFYAQALATYSERPMREFLYLQTYPFAWRATTNTPVFSFDPVPANFVTNRSLQRRFVQTMLRRAQGALEVPAGQDDSYQDASARWLPSTVHILHGLIQLEPQVTESLPDLLPALRETREKILVSISVDNQKLFLEPGREAAVTPPNKSFAERIEEAQKEPDVYERDQLFASAVLGSREEKVEDVVEAIDKVSDSNLRAQLTEWFYFVRAATVVQAKQVDEAERLASRVAGLEQRAFLHVEMGKALINRNDARASEFLDLAITEAKKAGATIFAARSLLTAANLYLKIDLSRSIEILADAINCINRIEAPDFVSDDQAVEKTPVRMGRGGRYEGEYLFRFYMPGMDPEIAFREFGKIDFDTALSQSNALKDKFQRTMSTLALADVCLQQTKIQLKQRKRSVRP